ncbi:MAG TPA: hypothetical protein VNT51_05865 [Miltoncostaeaceae bacterium]|nr:hypothetical protein [Miltoncostaeaceae bacterium]
MPTPDLAAIASAAKATIEAASVTLNGQALKVYGYEPAYTDALPAATIRLARFTRRDLDDGELELGSAFWDLTYEVTLVADLDRLDAGQSAMQAVLAQVIDAFDDSPDLGRPSDVDDAVLASGEQSFVVPDDDNPDARPLVVVTCDLLVRAKST